MYYQPEVSYQQVPYQQATYPEQLVYPQASYQQVSYQQQDPYGFETVPEGHPYHVRVGGVGKSAFVKHEPAEYRKPQDLVHLSTVNQVRMLMVWNDYNDAPQEWGRLDTAVAAKDMRIFAREFCQVQDFNELCNTGAHKAAVIAKMQEIGQRCIPGDVFVYYYTGHGDLNQVRGRRPDGSQDEAQCLLGANPMVDPYGNPMYTPDGRLAYSCSPDGDWLEGEELSKTMREAIGSKNVRILVLSDSCHSGSILDVGQADWNNHNAISMTGCADTQESTGTGQGGTFTNSLLHTVARLMHSVNHDYTKFDFSVGRVHNKAFKTGKTVFREKTANQDFQIQCAPGKTPCSMPWPLVPKKPHYRSPWCLLHPELQAQIEAMEKEEEAGLGGQPAPATNAVYSYGAPSYAAPGYVPAPVYSYGAPSASVYTGPPIVSYSAPPVPSTPTVHAVYTASPVVSYGAPPVPSTPAVHGASVYAAPPVVSYSAPPVPSTPAVLGAAPASVYTAPPIVSYSAQPPAIVQAPPAYVWGHAAPAPAPLVQPAPMSVTTAVPVAAPASFSVAPAITTKTWPASVLSPQVATYASPAAPAVASAQPVTYTIAAPTTPAAPPTYASTSNVAGPVYHVRQ